MSRKRIMVWVRPFLLKAIPMTKTVGKRLIRIIVSQLLAKLLTITVMVMTTRVVIFSKSIRLMPLTVLPIANTRPEFCTGTIPMKRWNSPFMKIPGRIWIISCIRKLFGMKTVLERNIGMIRCIPILFAVCLRTFRKIFFLRVYKESKVYYIYLCKNETPQSVSAD